MASEKHQFNLPEFEEKILKLWEEKHIFELTLEKTKKGTPFVFYEGPPTANGLPHMGHALTRAFKDLIPRYKTMRGFFVPRKAGWDTHGLPVEIQVEKELGLKNKQEIEQYGIAPFNAKAKESVWRYKEEWDRLTRRMGFWLDLDHPYITYDPLYMETLWWIIKEFWNRKLLVEDFKIVPWCTRCQTGLSTHELAQGYKLVKDKSVYVKFKLDAGQKIGDFVTDDYTYILAWTTTPWTLPGNVALAVNPNLTYIRIEVESDGNRWNCIVAKDRWGELTRAFEKNRQVTGTVLKIFHGNDLVNLSYSPLFEISEFQESDTAYKIYSADFVTAGDGTGVVHTAVMYGEDDYKLGKKVGLPTFHTVDETGKFVSSVKELAGLKAKNKETEEKIIELLKVNNLLFAVQEYPHDYPFCWRCGTPILYYARNAWWVRVTAVKKELLANNETIDWVPDHLKKGRFGEFLKDVRDWAFSRERYWGTPLPIWKCDLCEEIEVIGSREELAQKNGNAQNRYFIMRHGEAENNAKKIYNSAWPEITKYNLTLKGRMQVEKAAQRLKHKKINLIVASPFTRTRETAEIVSSILGVGIQYDERMREMFWGMLHETSEKEGDHFFATISERFTQAAPGGETLSDVRKRVFAVLSDLEKKYTDQNILIISHSDPLWMLYSAALGLSNDEAAALRTGAQAKVLLSYAEIRMMSYRQLPRDKQGEVNLHRPYVDTIEFPCKKCRGTMCRVPEVVDVWFDSGAMPFAQAHYPFSKEKLAFPADYISEAVDQTRGWFYTLLAISTLLGKKAPYKHVISLGHVLDKNGQKMSKSKGNVVSPWDMIQKYGIDTLRWYFYSINAPGEPKRFDEKDLTLKQRSFLGTWWNSYVLFDTYVKNIKRQKAKGKSAEESKNVLDQWILTKLDMLIREVTEKLENYDITTAARAIEQFTVSDFSQWYLRRSRERFQRPRSAQEKKEAAETTAYVLDILCRLTAPFTPFLSEYIYQELRKKTGQEEISVHLLDWPSDTGRLGHEENILIHTMERTRHFCSLALRDRAEKGVKVRQPLMSVKFPDKNPVVFIGVIKDEDNVKEVLFGQNIGKSVMHDLTITPELHEEGMVREFMRNIQEMRRELGLTPAQKAKVMVSGDAEREAMIARFKKKIQKDTNLSELRAGGKKVFRMEREIDLDGKKFWVGIS